MSPKSIGQKKFTWFVVLVALAIFGGYINSVLYVPFKPVYRSGDRLVVSEEPLNEEFKANIEFVFSYHSVPYQVDEAGTILIQKSLWNDKDTLWNYTTRANDANWLENRPSWDNKP